MDVWLSYFHSLPSLHVRSDFTDVFPGHVHPIHASPALSPGNGYVSHTLGHVGHVLIGVLPPFQTVP